MKKTERSLASPAARTVLGVMLAAFVLCTVIAMYWMDFNIPTAAVNLFLSLVALIFSLLLYVLCINSVPWDERQKRAFSRLTVAVFLSNLALLLSSGSELHPRLWRVTGLLYTLQYLFPSACWLLFWSFQQKPYRHLGGEKPFRAVFYGFFGVYCVLVVVNYFTGFCFAVLPDGSFVIRSRLIYLLTVLWLFVYLAIALLTRCPLKTRLTLASFSLFPLIVWVPMLLLPHSEFYLNVFSCFSMFSYVISLYLLFFNIYLESSQLFLRREKELEASRANAMALKISPHFIANTMSSIVALCHPGAPKAEDLASKFASYLRDNYTDITEEPMIPFSKELEHIRNYLAIEQVRFPRLQVEYDVQTDAFRLPTLTVQPLVENAVRHGITKKPDAAGTLKISSLETDRAYLIRIADDGVGYHPPQQPDGKKHIGIANAQARLSLLCGGSLTVTALPECGTVCEIQIPKGETP